MYNANFFVSDLSRVVHQMRKLIDRDNRPNHYFRA
jgi:hypothetical protein